MPDIGESEGKSHEYEGKVGSSSADRSREQAEAEGMEGGQSGMIEITEDEAITIIAFIKNHELDEIPDDVWELYIKLYNEVC